jgi:hypothetical protein
METNDRIKQLLDGEFHELRCDNHVTPDAILVYDEEADSIEEIDLMDLPLRYPCGPGCRWSDSDLRAIVKEKALLYRQSMISHEISDEDREATPACGTVVLVITRDHRPYKWLRVVATIEPGQ